MCLARKTDMDHTGNSSNRIGYLPEKKIFVITLRELFFLASTNFVDF